MKAVPGRIKEAKDQLELKIISAGTVIRMQRNFKLEGDEGLKSQRLSDSYVTLARPEKDIAVCVHACSETRKMN